MDELLFVYLVFIHIKGKLRYKHCLTFSLRPAEANGVPENSLQRRCLYEAEWSGFPSLERGQQRPHHCGNVQLGRPDSEPPSPQQLRRLAEANFRSKWMFRQTSSSPGQLLSMVHTRLGFGQSNRERFMI
ncbi:hypothetical protein AMECASPLE_008781 [Ameca splendens]|uniref:Uncharacterized protein n=1 Tax=Ameca splendens TaxID=208324 RepID=A0ABV0Y049_9TELE